MHVRIISPQERSEWAAFARAARKARRWSQQRLADDLGVARTTVYRWESSAQRPEDPNVVLKFAAALGVDQDEALRAAGLVAKSQPPRPTMLPDEEIDRIEASRLSPARKRELIQWVYTRRERERRAALEMLEMLIDAAQEGRRS